MNIIFYKAKYGDKWDKIISILTFGPYSHCELVFSDGVCFSSSPRDGGVRFKVISISEHWDVFNLNVSPEEELKIKTWCASQVGLAYDWLGVLGVLLPFRLNARKKWFCSEICITALKHIINISPKNSPNYFAKYLEMF